MSLRTRLSMIRELIEEITETYNKIEDKVYVSKQEELAALNAEDGLIAANRNLQILLGGKE